MTIPGVQEKICSKDTIACTVSLDASQKQISPQPYQFRGDCLINLLYQVFLCLSPLRLPVITVRTVRVLYTCLQFHVEYERDER